jgi:hypothetical protein
MKKNKYTYIYGLSDLENGLIRYVGKSDNPKRRIQEHKQSSKFKITHRDTWINSVLQKGGFINLIILEIVDFNNWKEKEIYWIDKYKNNKLTNHDKGGSGGSPIKYTKTYNQIKQWIKRNVKTVKSAVQWQNYIRENEIPKFIPRNPFEVYKNRGWLSWGDFLNTNNKETKSILRVSYSEAKKIVKGKFESKPDFLKRRCDITDSIPSNPERYYKNKGWISWGDFLNTNRSATKNKKFINYVEFVKWCKSQKILTNLQWRKIRKDRNIRPDFIPSSPEQVYKRTGEWISFSQFYIDVNN